MDNHIIIRDPAVKHECRRIKTKQLIMQKPKIVIILVHTLCHGDGDSGSSSSSGATVTAANQLECRVKSMSGDRRPNEIDTQLTANCMSIVFAYAQR